MKFHGLCVKIIFWLLLVFPCSNSNALTCSNCIQTVYLNKNETSQCTPLAENEVVKNPDYCMIYTLETFEKVIKVIVEIGYKNYAGQPPVNTCNRVTKQMLDFNIDIGSLRLPKITGAIKNSLVNYTTSNATYCSCDSDFCNTYGSAPKWVPGSDLVTQGESSLFSGRSISSILFLTGLAVVLLLILLCGGISIFSWYKYTNVECTLYFLTSTDIDNFRDGAKTRDPNDPYASIHQLPFNHTMEIDKRWIAYSDKDILGSGQFGVVYKGAFCRKCAERGVETGEKEDQLVVAIKTVNAETVDVETFKSLLSEIKIMSYLATDKHKNILLFLGASTMNIKYREALAIVEFCPNGDLLTFLRQRKDTFRNLFKDNTLSGDDEPDQNGKSFSGFSNSNYVNTAVLDLSTVDLLKFSLGIANGMQYLTIKDVIHGDLAARNVLLGKNLEPKISDFGLSRQLLNYSNYFKTTEVPLPFKWMSIEAMTARKFSIQSDVWSFGVVLTEIFTLGDIPYPGLIVDENFVLKIARGYRMEAPKYSNDQLYNLMLDCWTENAADRPPFSVIFQKLQELYSTFSTMELVEEQRKFFDH